MVVTVSGRSKTAISTLGSGRGGGHVKNSPGARDSSLASISYPDVDDDEADFLKDVYEPSGVALTVLEITTAFRLAGYGIRKTELSPHNLPVAVFRLLRRTAAQFSDHAQFVQRVRQILESVGIDVPKADLLAEQNGNTVLVAFIWQPPAPGSAEAMGMDELLALRRCGKVLASREAFHVENHDRDG